MLSPNRQQPIVHDDCEPYDHDIDCFTEEDLRGTSLAELYQRACRRLGIKPNPQIAAQLPRTVERKPYYQVMILNGKGTYLGNRGVAALVPVIDVCPRLTHLLLPRVGLKANVAKTLIKHLLAHPGIRELNLSYNDLGVTVGQMLLQLLIRHRRIYGLDIVDTLIIPPIKRKIEAQLNANVSLKASFEVPLIPLDIDEEAQARAIRAEEEKERARRAEELRREVAERIPSWAPAALAELHSVLMRHRRYMENVFSVFQPSAPMEGVSVGVGALRCTPKSFKRAMQILGVTSLVDEEKCVGIAEILNSWISSERLIAFHSLIFAMREHAGFTPGDDGAYPVLPLPMQHAVDRIFDIRESLRSSFELIDVDNLRKLPKATICAGLFPATRSQKMSCRIVNLFLYRRSEAEDDAQVPDEMGQSDDDLTCFIHYDDFLDSFRGVDLWTRKQQLEDITCEPDERKWMVNRSFLKALAGPGPIL
jgi:hypothetical protein